jgi:hypothetical protein
VTITGTTISGNLAQLGGGGIYNEASLSLTNSTISGNQAVGTSSAFGGGGLYESQSATATLTRVTVAFNTIASGQGSGIDNETFFGSEVTLEGTILAGNDCAGRAPVSSGHNLDEGTSCALAGAGDLSSVGNAMLLPLASNRGRTLTHMPAADSPAVDAGGATCAATPTDQRGVARPQGAACDIGAVEWSDLIFEDDFESGDLARWSLHADGGGDLSVTPAAAMASTTRGMQATVNDTGSLFVEDISPSGEKRYRARFYLDPNGFDPGETAGHFRTRLFVLFDDAVPGTRRAAAVVLKRQGGAYSLILRCRRDDNSQASSTPFPISAGPHWIEIDWQAATTASSHDGAFSLGVDGPGGSALGAVQNAASTIGAVRLGTLNVKAGAAGTVFFDEFVSKRKTAIGPVN